MEEKTMEQVIKENWERTRLMKIERNARAKKEKIKETILTIAIGTFIVAITMMFLNNSYNENLNNCINAGHTAQYCERGL